MKRLIDIIQQDIAIWDLTPKESENIFCVGINSKIIEKNTLNLNEDDLIDAWVQGFKVCMRKFKTDSLNLYKGIDRSADFKWMYENPCSWIHL